MAKWPNVSVSKLKVKTRGGAKTYSKVSIEISSKAPGCGKEFKARKRANITDERSVETELRDNLGIDMRAHIASCNKCQG